MSLSSDDIVQITQLYARYNHAVDDGDTKGVAACFAEDAVFDLAAERMVGRDAIVEFIATVPEMLPGIRHIADNVIVEGSGDEAVGAAYLVVLIAGAEPKVMMTGRYRDQLRRDDGSWVWVRRVMTPDT